ncbi:diguanylate phosphodiesterase metal dependent hydrolase domain protein [Thermodesulfobium narugense DSM 14796]|uniref:Diguanylate phosphodiesterase metal dependent hydrolase domain protein n=1 Tax=Thermodesulfobium narugense DSM 14796 TaxID=747365 RepID=M1E8Y9_9BACT|nr:HDOD domain-containing protein [Thermodesulfobium narugense]AEE15220.1 diguanylate phosphodiesterase metal dependent hydrolase domain protein [Thermodesulfobium narugense DSM 14796]
MDVVVARQPIFNKVVKVKAYELLFRKSIDSISYDAFDGESSTIELLKSSLSVIGLDVLTNGLPAFINFTGKLLRDDVPSLLPPNKVVIEVLETSYYDLGISDTVKAIKKKGYKIALDDFFFKNEFKDLIMSADYIKVDFLQVTDEEKREYPKKISSIKDSITFLAEKIETYDDFLLAKESGYSLFQGYFFSKPSYVSRKSVPLRKQFILNLLDEAYKENWRPAVLEDLIKRDLSLSFRLLKFMNSIYFGFRNRINSIKQAIVLLGKNEFLKWLSLIALGELADDKPEELVTLSIFRAKMCENIGQFLSKKNDDLSNFFMTGLFSSIDALLDRPRSELINELPINALVKAALMGEKNIYFQALELVISYEKTEVDKFYKLLEKLKLNFDDVMKAYLEAIRWSSQLITF